MASDANEAQLCRALDGALSKLSAVERAERDDACASAQAMCMSLGDVYIDAKARRVHALLQRKIPCRGASTRLPSSPALSRLAAHTNHGFPHHLPNSRTEARTACELIVNGLGCAIEDVPHITLILLDAEPDGRTGCVKRLRKVARNIVNTLKPGLGLVAVFCRGEIEGMNDPYLEALGYDDLPPGALVHDVDFASGTYQGPVSPILVTDFIGPLAAIQSAGGAEAAEEEIRAAADKLRADCRSAAEALNKLNEVSGALKRGKQASSGTKADGDLVCVLFSRSPLLSPHSIAGRATLNSFVPSSWRPSLCAHPTFRRLLPQVRWGGGQDG